MNMMMSRSLSLSKRRKMRYLIRSLSLPKRRKNRNDRILKTKI